MLELICITTACGKDDVRYQLKIKYSTKMIPNAPAQCCCHTTTGHRLRQQLHKQTNTRYA